MLFETGTPASLPLGLVRLTNHNKNRDAHCLLGLTVQHPPGQLFAQAHEGLSVTGPRADRGYQQAVRFLAHHGLPQQAMIEIELSIPALVGLGSTPLLGLSIARALAWLHNLPPDQRQPAALAQAVGLDAAVHGPVIRSFEQGGLLLTEISPSGETLPPVVRRAEIAHEEKDAWAFVFFFPRIPDDTPNSLEMDRLHTRLTAAQHLSPESESVVLEQLWPALANDDIAAFGRALMALQALNRAALAQAGVSLTVAPEHQAVLDLMQTHGALAWGQSLTGFCFFGLVHGAKRSIDLRTALRRRVGPFGGQVMATITANTGARFVEQAGDLNLNKWNPITTR